MLARGRALTQFVSQILIPGEEIFFHSEEPFTQSCLEMLFCGCSNRVWKLGVTNKRIVAQKKESACFGTCQLNAREDCWPIENVAKVQSIPSPCLVYLCCTAPSAFHRGSLHLHGRCMLCRGHAWVGARSVGGDKMPLNVWRGDAGTLCLCGGIACAVAAV